MVLCLDCYLVLFRCAVWFFSYTSYTQELWKPQSKGENMCLYGKRGACTFFSMTGVLASKPVEGDCTCAMELYSTAVEGVIQGTRFGKPRELRKSLPAASATLYMETDARAQSRGCRLPGLLCDQLSSDQKSKGSLKTSSWVCGEGEGMVPLLFQTRCRDQVSLKNKLPLLEIPGRGTTRNKQCRCSNYNPACSFDDVLQYTVRHLTRTRQDTICGSGLKHRVGVYAFWCLPRAVDSPAGDGELQTDI